MLYSPQVQAYYYQDADGTCPVREFLLAQPARVQAQAEARIQLLADLGHRLRRPYGENVGGGIWELRWHTGRVQYRILYFFHGRNAVVLAHAFTKERAIPDVDLARALQRRQLFIRHPQLHTKP